MYDKITTAMWCTHCESDTGHTDVSSLQDNIASLAQGCGEIYCTCDECGNETETNSSDVQMLAAAILALRIK